MLGNRIRYWMVCVWEFVALALYVFLRIGTERISIFK